MSQVEFDEQNLDSYTTSYTNKKSFIVGLVEKLGVPEEYVNYVLVAIAICIFALSIFIFLKS